MTRAKICGNRTIEEALTAIQCGADAVGILVGPHSETQRHFVAPEEARIILAALPPFVNGVIVTTHNTIEDIGTLIQTTGTTYVQCHSDISAADIMSLRQRFPAVQFIAVIHIENEASIERAQAYATVAHALLLDTAQKEITGGTGITHNWNVSAMIVQSVKVPVILAGGLHPENVREAITTVTPYAVDVRSGVSIASGDKDSKKMQAFTTIAHNL